MTTGKIYLKSDGTPWRPIVHIEDISRAFLAVLQASAEVYSIKLSMSVRPHRITVLARSRISSRRVFRDAGLNMRVMPVLISDPIESISTRSQRVPAFKPRGMPVWAQNSSTRLTPSGLTLEEFEGPRYQRIGHIKKLLVRGRNGRDLAYTQRRSPSRTVPANA